MAQTIEHKRGDTFNWTGWIGPATSKESLLGMSFAAQMRDRSGALIYAFVVVVDTVANTFALTAAPAVTETWAPGDYVCDIQMSDSTGTVRSTPTFGITIVADITQ